MHAHVIAEFDAADAEMEGVVETLLVRWRDLVEAEGVGKAADMFARTVADRGDAFEQLETAQTELWEEAEDPIARALQYCIRDVCQGVEAWNLEGCRERVEELFAGVGGAKLHRLLGHWRQPAEDRFGPDEGDKKATVSDDDPVDVVGGDIMLGTVDTVVYSALSGDLRSKEILSWLLASLKNTSSVVARMREELCLIAR